MMHEKIRRALLKASRCAGNQSQLARLIDINSSRLNKWINRNRKIPFDVAQRIEEATQGQVTCEELMPECEPLLHHCQQKKKRLAEEE